MGEDGEGGELAHAGEEGGAGRDRQVEDAQDEGHGEGAVAGVRPGVAVGGVRVGGVFLLVGVPVGVGTVEEAVFHDSVSSSSSEADRDVRVELRRRESKGAKSNDVRKPVMVA